MRSGDVNFRLLGFVGWLRKELDQRGWDQKALAERAGRPEAEIRKVLQGTLTVGPLKDIAQALGISHQVIFIKAILPEDLPQKREVQKSVRLLNSLL